MKDSTRKKLINLGILGDPKQSRKDFFSLTNIGAFIFSMGVANLILYRPEEGWSMVMVIVTIFAGLFLGLIGILRDKDKKKNSKERNKDLPGK